MSVVCVKNQSQVVVDTSLLYVHVLPETREKQTARNVGGNYKKTFVLVCTYDKTSFNS